MTAPLGATLGAIFFAVKTWSLSEEVKVALAGIVGLCGGGGGRWATAHGDGRGGDPLESSGVAGNEGNVGGAPSGGVLRPDASRIQKKLWRERIPDC